MQPSFFFRTRGEFAFQAAHAREHRVDILEDVGWGGGGGGLGGETGFFEEGFHRRGFFFDIEVCDFEVLAEELEGETEEGLVLGLLADGEEDGREGGVRGLDGCRGSVWRLCGLPLLLVCRAHAMMGMDLRALRRLEIRFVTPSRSLVECCGVGVRAFESFGDIE